MFPIQTGTAVYVEALPPPPVVIVESKEGGQYGAGERREEGGGGGGGGGKREAGESLQVTVNGALQSNRKKYGLLQTMVSGGGGSGDTYIALVHPLQDEAMLMMLYSSRRKREGEGVRWEGPLMRTHPLSLISQRARRMSSLWT